MQGTQILNQAMSAQPRGIATATRKTLDSLFVEAAAAYPGKTALVAHRKDRPGQPVRLTYAELADRVSRAAAALQDLGLKRGDVVSIQLPNWWEFAVAFLACLRIGVVVNPMTAIFRERELAYMLEHCESKAFIVPKASVTSTTR